MTVAASENEDVLSSVLPTLADLANRAKLLLSELEEFRQHLRNIRHEGQVEIAHFRGTVQSELGMLERLLKSPDDKSTGHIARSSNLPFLEKVWETAKRSNRLTALQKRIYYNSPQKSLANGLHYTAVRRTREDGLKNAAVTIDAITDAGLTWTKVSLVTNTRLLFDLAKLGWRSEGSEDEDESNFAAVEDDDFDIPLVKTARDICIAAQSFRARTRQPVVHLILPRIRKGETDEVDRILEQCRDAGAIVLCGDDVESPPPLKDTMDTMAPDPIRHFSDTLNIDCTILLALVSEFSHARVSKEPWFHRALQRQVEIEGNENLLPSLLYPALSNHPLVCTAEAAKRMREIVSTIGTPSEKARTAVLLGEHSQSQPALVREMQQWSAYAVPEQWQLPIKVVQPDEIDWQMRLPPEADACGKSMTAINRSVFLHGWVSGITTITSNRAVVKQLEADLEKHESLDDDVWPQIWLCPTARSLVGKEKRGAKKDDRKEGAWPLPDPLRREEQRRNGLDVLSSREGRVVADLRPNGYPCEDVLEAKNEARRLVENQVK